MTTGKIEYAPDYLSQKSATEVVARMDEIIRRDLARQRERARLEREVIEAAKRDRLVVYEDGAGNREIDEMIQMRAQLNQAVDALLSFEAKQSEPAGK